MEEHIIADMAYLLAQDGEGVVEHTIDGSQVRAFRGVLEEDGGSYDGQIILRKQLHFLPGAIEAVVGQAKTIDGKSWEVVATATQTGLFIVTFERYTT